LANRLAGGRRIADAGHRRTRSAHRGRTAEAARRVAGPRGRLRGLYRLLKALQKAGYLEDQDRLIPWFYRILNNAIVDYYRRRTVETKHQAELALDSAPDAGADE
jgi:DNA-directed RNA polymerase specialized sigma24 family protein